MIFSACFLFSYTQNLDFISWDNLGLWGSYILVLIIAWSSHYSTVKVVQESKENETYLLNIISMITIIVGIIYLFINDSKSSINNLFNSIFYLAIIVMMLAGNYINPQAVNQAFFGIIVYIFIARNVETKWYVILLSLIPFFLVSSGFFDITGEKGLIGGALGMSFGMSLLIYLIFVIIFWHNPKYIKECALIPDFSQLYKLKLSGTPRISKTISAN